MKAVFWIHGSLPAGWEDFYSKTDGVPSITIFTKNEKGEEDDDPLFRFIKIDEDILTEEIARDTIKRVLNLEHVLIIQAGEVQAI